MERFKFPVPVDRESFGPDSNELPARYGLPETVSYCSSCVISNQRPSSSIEFQHQRDEKKRTIRFDENHVCDACKFAELKKGIDWQKREQEFRDLCDRHRRNDGRYDCLLPGSGGKDSFYAAHLLKHKYGMNPLTVTWAPHIYTEWGWQNFESWIHAGFDNVLFTPNGRIHRLLTRLAVENLLHPFQPFILGQKNLAPKAALNFGIQLVIYGENEAEYGNPVEDNTKATRDSSYFTLEDKSNVYLGGVSVADLEGQFGVTGTDLSPYMPADFDAVRESGIEVHYLGYYEPWHPQNAYYYAVEHGNFQASPERTPGTYSKYNSIDDKVDDLHYYTTWIKFGIGRATYDAAQEIRNEDITRDEGVALVKRFDGEFPERFIEELFEYLSIPEKEFPTASKMFEQPIMDAEYFSNLCDRFRSPHLWVWRDGQWQLRHKVWRD
tara:strand:+ start:19031 stop:20344 length:1314 start_codon:yes stop_codon:yes gene_type:complete